MRFYFIPAWYNPWRKWYDTTEPWFRGGAQFDDTISQLNMFEKTGQTTQLLILNYAPNLRYLSHRYDLFEVDKWSLFDQVQGLVDAPFRTLMLQDLNWPQGAEFIFTPFMATVRLEGRDYAHVDFGEAGQLIWVDYEPTTADHKRFIFDDRGFVSSIVYYQEGQEHHQDYLDVAGDWQIREYLLPDDRHVEVAETAHYGFKQTSYTSIDDLVEEVFGTYLEQIDRADTCLMVAAHPNHNQLVKTYKGQKKLVLSYYQNRVELADAQAIMSDASASALLVCDSMRGTELLMSYTEVPVVHVSPFDTRLSLGKSQRLKALKLHMVIDGLMDEELVKALEAIVGYMDVNSHVQLDLVTYEGDQGRREVLMEKVQEVIEACERPYLFIEDQEADKPTFYEITEEEPIESRLTLSYLGSETDILKAIEYTRLILDFQDEPHLYTQIAGISAGIPQLNRVASEFMDHLKNGYLLEDFDQLEEVLAYYLDGLANWNQALVYTVQKIDDYTSGRLVNRLIEKLE